MPNLESMPQPCAGEIRVRIGGPAGFGIKAAGQSLARVFARAGYHTFDLTEYPSLIKGGHNTYHLRVGEQPIFSHVLPTDILVALDARTVELHLSEITEGGAIVFDPTEVDISTIDGATADRYCLVDIPLKDIVREAGGRPIMRNIAALGAVLGHMGFPLDGLAESIREQFAHKAPEIAEQNIAVATAGWNRAHEYSCDFPHRLSPREGEPKRMLVDGNEAIGIGALAAGIGLYCAYPMTPASSLLHFMARHADDEKVVVKHTEDELAAMNMVVGGAFAGTRSMCATSGGGFSLMVEAFGLAGVSESAVVVGLFTRPGPATGMPTWTEQSDLRFALHAAQGEFPRIILAPGDRTQAFELTWKAFNLADQLQTPVVVLGDSYLSDNRQTVVPFDSSAIIIDRGRLLAEGDVTEHPEVLGDPGTPYEREYLRYKVTEDGVSTRVLPGVRGATQVVNSYEHDERGYGAQGEDAQVRVAQDRKRLRKLKLGRSLVPPPRRHGPAEADISVIAFGTTIMPVLEAMGWLEREEIQVNLLQIVTLWPFPAEEVGAFLDSARRTLIVEGNATGQLEGLVRQECLREIEERLRRYDGRPFAPEQVYVRIHELLGMPVTATPSGWPAREVRS